jgi:hypothetical protein
MAAGDVYNQGVTATALNTYFTIQPTAGVEVVIHNITHSTDATLEFFDGTNSVIVDTQVGNGSWMGMFLHCTNSKYYRVKNTNASSNNICCDGVQTK